MHLQTHTHTHTQAKEVFAAALESVDAEASTRVKKEKNWRFGYNKHVYKSMVSGHICNMYA